MNEFRQLSTRDRLTLDEAAKLGNLLVPDSRRSRPLYFDGRFLTAADLTRDQQWNLARESDIGRALGVGIGGGLEISVTAASRLRVDAGYGVAPSGDLIALPASINIDLLALADQQSLDVALGIAAIPRPSPRNRSGLFILAARPVEFTALPVAAYPASLTGQRTTQDGEIVEAVAFTLIPYAPDREAADADQQRSLLARDVFAYQRGPTTPVNALPLAMLSLSNGVINWLDMHMVRRTLASSRSVDTGFGLTPRSLREAHLAQYSEHLRAVLAGPGNNGSFAASDFFSVLPSAGPMPARSFDRTSQVFFPPAIAVDFALIPRDELAGLIEESLSLPPIDLTLPAEQLDSMNVLVVAPLPRDEFERALVAAPPAPPTPPLRSRRPLETLQTLVRRAIVVPPKRLEVASDEATRRVADGLRAKEAGRPTEPLFWYVRRRNFPYRPESFSRPVETVTQELATENATFARLLALFPVTPPAPPNPPVPSRLSVLFGRTSRAAQGLILRSLASPAVGSDNATLAAAFVQFESLPGQIDSGSAQRVATAIAVRKFGEGVIRISQADPDFDFANDGTGARMIAASGQILEIDAMAARLPEDKLKEFLKELGEAARAGDREKFDQTFTTQQQEI